jgi:phosphomannomutase
MLDPKVFKAYDVRGVYPAQLDEEGGYAIGRACVERFEPVQIAVGRDMRISSPSMAEATIIGATVRVHDGGQPGTDDTYGIFIPSVLYDSGDQQLEGGNVQIP